MNVRNFYSLFVCELTRDIILLYRGFAQQSCIVQLHDRCERSQRLHRKHQRIWRKRNPWAGFCQVSHAVKISLDVNLQFRSVCRYLQAPSVAVKQNITWAGQTLGTDLFKADGRLQGEESVQTITCTADGNGGNVCNVKVPAPGFALVFLSDGALKESTPASTMTFATTSVTKTVRNRFAFLAWNEIFKPCSQINTATVDPAVLATSNGQDGKVRAGLGSTSKGSANAARSSMVAPGVATLLALLAGVSIFRRRL